MSGTSPREVLLVRADSVGDVLLMGPAVRAVAASARVTMLVSPEGRAAAELLPGVSRVLTYPFPWSGYQPPPMDTARLSALVGQLRRIGPEAAIIFTSYHQSPLPTALVLRAAGIGWIGATSEDYPGSLLDLRHRRPGPVDGPVPPGANDHEVMAALALVGAAGFHPPDGDLLLAVRHPLPRPPIDLPPTGRYVVVHPGAGVPARTVGQQRATSIVEALAKAGWPVVVTGTEAQRPLTAQVSGDEAIDAGGQTTLAQLAWVLEHAACVVVGNTGPAHLAAAVGTPVVSLFSPVVPASRWAPWGVPATLLGDQFAACSGTGARSCPVPGHPCLDRIDPATVVSAVAALAGRPYANSAASTAGVRTLIPTGLADVGEDLPRTQLYTRMAGHRAYLHPHRWTSLGLSLIEAMTIGMPVLALATTAAPEAIPATAGTVSCDVDRLTAAAAHLLEDRDEAARQGQAARAAALARFGLRRFLTDWDRIIKEVVS